MKEDFYSATRPPPAPKWSSRGATRRSPGGIFRAHGQGPHPPTGNLPRVPPSLREDSREVDDRSEVDTDNGCTCMHNHLSYPPLFQVSTHTHPPSCREPMSAHSSAPARSHGGVHSRARRTARRALKHQRLAAEPYPSTSSRRRPLSPTYDPHDIHTASWDCLHFGHPRADLRGGVSQSTLRGLSPEHEDPIFNPAPELSLYTAPEITPIGNGPGPPDRYFSTHSIHSPPPATSLNRPSRPPEARQQNLKTKYRKRPLPETTRYHRMKLPHPGQEPHHALGPPCRPPHAPRPSTPRPVTTQPTFGRARPSSGIPFRYPEDDPRYSRGPRRAP